MDLLSMIAHQGLVAWFVLGLLAVLSVLVWAAIFLKATALRRADKGYDRLLTVFRDRSSSFQEVRAWCWDQDDNPYARLVLSGTGELESVGPPSAAPERWDIQRASLERALRQGIRRETTRSRRWMPLLATAGNVSPFIGLFGTVWGIMRSFHEIGLAGAASLAVVAPGISEALLATAAGLFAAIPAVMAFNHFRSRIAAQSARLQDVADEVLNALEHERLLELEPDRRPMVAGRAASMREDA